MYPCVSDLFVPSYARAMARNYLRRLDFAMPEDSPLVRQWIVLRTLCARRYGATVKEMVEEMGVSEKTIRRDLETFTKAGFPLVETVGDYGRKKWRLDPTKTQPGLAFTYDEAIALYLGRHLLEPLAGTMFWKASQQAFKKIRASLGSSALEYVEQFGSAFHQTTVGASDYSKKADLIDELMIGIEDQRAVCVTYQSLRATEPVTYDVYPYGLTYHRGSLYLVGRSPDHDEMRHWKVDRMENAEPTDKRFQRPEDFDLHEHLSRSFGIYEGDGDVQVRVWFSPVVARYVSESIWHPSQLLTPQNDCSLLAAFRLDGTQEIKAWILSFGHHAEVLGPEELRREIANELNAMLVRYQRHRGRTCYPKSKTESRQSTRRK